MTGSDAPGGPVEAKAGGGTALRPPRRADDRRSSSTSMLVADEFPRWPQHDHSEEEALLRVLRSNVWWRVAGQEVEAFEREFARATGAAAALAVTNGTHALELAMRVAGVRPGDEVLVPALTFISTSLAVQHVGAVPVVVDIDETTYAMDLDQAATLIGPRTTAIIPVHMAGAVNDLDSLAQLAAAHGLTLLQDAAHAPGAEWRGRPIGGFGSMACYSFQNGKVLTAGEGGCVTFSDEETRARAYLWHTCGRPPGDLVYRHEVPGMNLRMSEFAGAILRAQLARLDQQIERRTQRWQHLVAALAELTPGVVPQEQDSQCTRNPRYMAMFLLEGCRLPRGHVVAELVARGVPAFINYPPVYRTEAHWGGPTEPFDASELAARCGRAERIARDGLWIHHRVLLAEVPVVERLAEVIAGVVGTT